jgi:branched-chain amino acid:cation transporter, LIVCS family
VGVALFAMFFGAGNLIFPPYMGLMAGVDWRLALAGFLITGIGLPLLGIMAAARAGGTVEKLGQRVSPWFGTALSVVIILAIGPLLAIPRTCATAFELGVRPSLPGFSPWLFSVLFFGVTFWFSMNRSAVIDKIGKLLTPLLVFTLGWIIIAGLISPPGEVTDAGIRAPFGNGFREGYQTMDALASVVFAQIVLGALILKGYTNIKDQVRMTTLAGGIAAAGLGLVYSGLMYLGATSGSLYPDSVERTDLLIGIASGLMGEQGHIVLGVAVSLACLTTAIGLTATVAGYFSELFRNRLRYRPIAVITVVFSGFFATVGVTTIVNLAYPLLVTVYPVAIVLIGLTLAGGRFAAQRVYAGGVTGALLASIPEAFATAGLPLPVIHPFMEMIPLYDAGFSWILPALAGITTGLILTLFHKPATTNALTKPPANTTDLKP